MALTAPFSLQDVNDEIYGPGFSNSLVQCIADSNGGQGFTSLLDFNGYSHSSLHSHSLGYSEGDSFVSCALESTATYYTNNGSFSQSTMIYGDSSGTITAGTGYYSDGRDWLFVEELGMVVDSGSC